jgi:hypothetical protein
MGRLARDLLLAQLFTHPDNKPVKHLLKYGLQFPKVEVRSSKTGIFTSFQASTESILDNEGLAYCEGFIQVGAFSIPIPHAWVYDLRQGVAYELMLKARAIDYYGVVVPTQDVVEYCARSNQYGLLSMPSKFLNEFLDRVLPL